MIAPSSKLSDLMRIQYPSTWIMAGLTIATIVFVLSVFRNDSSGDSTTSTHSEGKGPRTTNIRSKNVLNDRPSKPVMPVFSYEDSLSEIRKFREDKVLRGLDAFVRLGSVLDSLDSEQLMSLMDEVVAMKDLGLLDAINGGLMMRLYDSGVGNERIQAWIENITAAPERDRLLQMAAYMHAETGRGGFPDFLAHFNKVEDKSSILQGYYSQLAKSQPERAIREFLDHLPGEVPYSSIAGVIWSVPETSNFRSLAGMVRPDSEPGAAEVRSVLLKKWGMIDPEGAVDYVLKSDHAATSQMAVAMESWCSADAAQAIKWLYTQGRSPKTDEAVKAVIRKRAAINPSETWRLAQLIEDQDARESVHREIYEKWRRYQPEDAEAAWQSSR